MGRRRQRKLFVPLERDIQAAEWRSVEGFRDNRRRSVSPPEKAVHAAVIEHWRVLREPGTLVATLANEGAMGQPGLTPGLPDLIVMGEGVPGRIALVELKREPSSPLSDAQKDIRDLCNLLGITWRVARGRDEPIAILEAWGVVRLQAPHDSSPTAARLGEARQGEAGPGMAWQGEARHGAGGERSADPQRGSASVAEEASRRGV